MHPSGFLRVAVACAVGLALAPRVPAGDVWEDGRFAWTSRDARIGVGPGAREPDPQLSIQPPPRTMV